MTVPESLDLTGTDKPALNADLSEGLGEADNNGLRVAEDGGRGGRCSWQRRPTRGLRRFT